MFQTEVKHRKLENAKEVGKISAVSKKEQRINSFVYLNFAIFCIPFFVGLEAIFRPCSIPVLLSYEERTMTKKGRVLAIILSLFSMPILLVLFVLWALPQAIINVIYYFYNQCYEEDIWDYIPSTIWTKKHSFFGLIYSIFLWIGGYQFIPDENEKVMEH